MAALMRLRNRHEKSDDEPLDPLWAEIQEQCERQMIREEIIKDNNDNEKNENGSTPNENGSALNRKQSNYDGMNLDEFVEAMTEKIKAEGTVQHKMAPRGGFNDRGSTHELGVGGVPFYVAYMDRLANSHIFNVACQSAILANAISMGFEVDYSEGNEEIFAICENVFCAFFLFELIVKLSATGKAYFTVGWNLLDFFLVSMTVLDVWILRMVFEQRDGNLQKMSVLRIMRILRVARMVRFLKVFKELWLIISGIIDSVKTIFWVSILLCLLLYISAILITQVTGHNRELYSYDQDVEDGHDFNNFYFFGTVSRSMVTLIMLVFTADPDEYIRAIAWKQPFMLCFFFLFVMFITFGVMNVIVGVIVDNTIDGVRTIDNEVRCQDQERKCRILKVFQMLFRIMDRDGSNSVDLEEMVLQFRRQDIWNLFKTLNLPINDPQQLFTFMAGTFGNTELTYEDFMSGLLLLTEKNQERLFANVLVKLHEIGARLAKDNDHTHKHLKKVKTAANFTVQTLTKGGTVGIVDDAPLIPHGDSEESEVSLSRQQWHSNASVGARGAMIQLNQQLAAFEAMEENVVELQTMTASLSKMFTAANKNAVCEDLQRLGVPTEDATQISGLTEDPKVAKSLGTLFQSLSLVLERCCDAESLRNPQSEVAIKEGRILAPHQKQQATLQQGALCAGCPTGACERPAISLM